MTERILSHEELDSLIKGLGSGDFSILVIDDKPQILRMLEAAFSETSYRVSTATDPQKGLELFKEGSFDLVIIDLKTPGMSGEELSKAFKRLNPDTEVIVFTTLENTTAAKECFQTGVLYEYIYKPTSNMEHFASTVKKAFERREARVQDRNRIKELIANTQKLEEKNRKLLEAQKLLVESEQKNIFNATVVATAHNFNQPLTSLLLYAELLEAKLGTEGVDPAELVGYIKSIKDSINHIHVIMEQLKQISLPTLVNYAAGVKMVELPEEPLVEAQAPAKRKKAAARKRGVLVVDDEVSISKLIEEILSSQGYQVFVANNGTQAFETYREKADDIELVITDVKMPEMEGIELFQKLKKITPSLKIIYMTGFSVEEEVYKHLREGAAGFIKKPFTLKELTGIVSKALPPMTKGE